MKTGTPKHLGQSIEMVLLLIISCAAMVALMVWQSGLPH